MQQRPFVSIIIPSRNRNAHVHECVQSLLGMDYPLDRFEVLVVDDGSRIPVVYSGPANVRVIRQAHGGPAAARNRGIESAQGTLLVFTDDDCRPRVDWLSQIVATWADAPATLIGGLTVNGLPENAYSTTSQFLVDYLYEYFEHTNPHQRFFTSNNFAVAREQVNQLAGFDASFPLPAAEDRDLCDRWRELGRNFLYLPSAVVNHYHQMSLQGFTRQQFQYGRGAKVLRERRSARGAIYPIEPSGFYFRLLSAPFARMRIDMAVKVTALLVVAQICNLAGFFYQLRCDRQAAVRVSDEAAL
jgi:GT2 family glycosyltransferase